MAPDGHKGCFVAFNECCFFLDQGQNMSGLYLNKVTQGCASVHAVLWKLDLCTCT